jgi:hypothetical protein
MENLVLEKNEDRFIIELNRKYFDDVFVEDLINWIRVEELSRKAKFDNSVLEVADEIKKDWWVKNGNDYLKDIIYE